MRLRENRKKRIEISLRSRIDSFNFAFQGLRQAWREPNMQIHLSVAILVIIAGCCIQLSKTEWSFVIIAISFVVIAELLNTSIEMLCDLYVGSAFHPKVKQIKDMSAGMVLIAAFMSAVIGVIVFIL